MKGRIEETKLFSTQAQDPAWLGALDAGSRSAADAAMRKSVYEKVFSKYEEMKEAYKAFSGITEIPLMSNQYFNATVASYARSFVGFLSIERDMPEPTALLWYDDVLGVSDNRVVMPNLGQETLTGINAGYNFSAELAAQAVANEISTGKKLIPGSVEINLIHVADGATTIIKDDRNGVLVGGPGVLAAGTVNYATGAISFICGDGFTVATGDKYSVRCYEDVAGTPETGANLSSPQNRFKLEHKAVSVTAEPDILIGESNLMSIAMSSKSLGSNPQDALGAKLVELYTKLINGKQVACVTSGFDGNAHAIDAAAWTASFHDFNSRLDAFSAQLIEVDTKLGQRSVKGVRASAYLVGARMGNWFRKLRQSGNFVENVESSYINDLLGHYNGIPVLRHNDVGDLDGYAIHKTPGGEIAPVMNGKYLPLTWTPAIGNYNQPTQVASGVYYSEGNKTIFPELIQKFTINAD